MKESKMSNKVDQNRQNQFIKSTADKFGKYNLIPVKGRTEMISWHCGPGERMVFLGRTGNRERGVQNLAVTDLAYNEHLL